MECATHSADRRRASYLLRRKFPPLARSCGGRASSAGRALFVKAAVALVALAGPRPVLAQEDRTDFRLTDSAADAYDLEAGPDARLVERIEELYGERGDLPMHGWSPRALSGWEFMEGCWTGEVRYQLFQCADDPAELCCSEDAETDLAREAQLTMFRSEHAGYPMASFVSKGPFQGPLGSVEEVANQTEAEVSLLGNVSRGSVVVVGTFAPDEGVLPSFHAASPEAMEGLDERTAWSCWHATVSQEGTSMLLSRSMISVTVNSRTHHLATCSRQLSRLRAQCEGRVVQGFDFGSLENAASIAESAEAVAFSGNRHQRTQRGLQRWVSVAVLQRHTAGGLCSARAMEAPPPGAHDESEVSRSPDRSDALAVMVAAVAGLALLAALALGALLYAGRRVFFAKPPSLEEAAAPPVVVEGQAGAAERGAARESTAMPAPAALGSPAADSAGEDGQGVVVRGGGAPEEVPEVNPISPTASSHPGSEGFWTGILQEPSRSMGLANPHVRAYLQELKRIGRKQHWFISADQLTVGRAWNIGSYGNVYKGRVHKHTKVLVRMPPEGFPGDKGALEAFADEVRILVRLRHANIVLTQGASIIAESNQLVVVTEWISGLSLDLFVPSASSLHRAKLIMDVARGTQYLHAQRTPIYHRELRPEKILVQSATDPPEAKVADYGFGDIFDPVNSASTADTDVGLTGMRRIYAALASEGFAMDVFAFGLILSFICSRKHPVSPKEDSPDNFVPARPCLPFPPAFQRYEPVLEMCIVEEPNDRPSMNVVLESLLELEAAAAGQSSI